MRAKVPTVFRRIQSPSLIVNKKFAVNRPILAPILLVPKLINVKPIHVNVFKIPNRVQVPFFPKTNWNFNQRNWFSDDIKNKIRDQKLKDQFTEPYIQKKEDKSLIEKILIGIPFTAFYVGCISLLALLFFDVFGPLTSFNELIFDTFGMMLFGCVLICFLSIFMAMIFFCIVKIVTFWL
jgi:hypothetical protein